MTAPALVGLARCGVGPLVVGLDLGRVVGVERAERIKPGDDGPTVTNRAGDWPVFNLADRLGLDHTPHPRTGQVVLLVADGRKFGLLVDRLTPIGRGERFALGPLPAAADAGSGLFAGTALLNTGPLLVLDPDRFFAEPTPPPERKLPAPAGRGRPVERLMVFGHTEHRGRPVGFGLPAGCVAEIADPSPGTPATAGASHVREVIDWRGRPVAVLDVAVWLGLPGVPADQRRVVILRPAAGGEPVGLAAGATVKVLPLPLPHMPPRRTIPLTPGRAAAVVDLTELTLVVPDVRQLLVGG